MAATDNPGVVVPKKLVPKRADRAPVNQRSFATFNVQILALGSPPTRPTEGQLYPS